MGAIRDLWDLLAPVGPERVDDWGEAISDAVDAGGGGFTDTFDLKADFGAEGNGTTDDAPSLRSAMSALSTAGGGMLFIPAGTYLLDSAATGRISTVPSNTRIIGAGRGATTLVVGGSVTGNERKVFFSDGTSDIEIGHLSIDGNKGALGTTSEADAIDFEAVVRPFVHHIDTFDSAGEGVDFDATVDGVIHAVTARGHNRNGIHVAASAGTLETVVSDCHASDCANKGFNIRGQRVLISNCTARNSGDEGFTLEAANSASIERGRILVSNCLSSGSGGLAEFEPTGNGEVVLTGCGTDTGTDAIRLEASVDLTVTGGSWVCDNNHGFNLRTGSGRVLVSGAHIISSGGRAIRVRGAIRASIIGCMTESGTIEFDSSGAGHVKDCIAEGNIVLTSGTGHVVMGNTTPSISDAATGSIIRNNVVNGSFVADGVGA